MTAPTCVLEGSPLLGPPKWESLLLVRGVLRVSVGPALWNCTTCIEAPLGGSESQACLRTDCFLNASLDRQGLMAPLTVGGWNGSLGECFFTQLIWFLRDPIGCLVWVCLRSTDAARAREMENTAPRSPRGSIA